MLRVGTVVLIVRHPHLDLVGRIGTIVGPLCAGLVFVGSGDYVLDHTYGVEVPSAPLPNGLMSWACRPNEIIPLYPDEPVSSPAGQPIDDAMPVAA